MPKELRRDLMDQLKVDDGTLNEELKRQPSKFAYYGALASRASKKLSREKAKLKELEANISKEFREHMKTDEPETRVTDSLINIFIVNTIQHQTQVKAVIEAQYGEDMLIMAKEAFRQRSHMILQLARMKADEMFAPDLTIFKKEAKGRHEDVTKGILTGRKKS